MKKINADSFDLYSCLAYNFLHGDPIELIPFAMDS